MKSAEKPAVSVPTGLVRETHINKDLSWSFDPSVNPKTIFTKLKTVGKGGFGVVCQIVHRPSMTVLAGKIVNNSLVDSNSQDELEKEIELLREVHSPYTVEYYGSINFDGSMMILMEYCNRGSLRDILDFKCEVLSEEQVSLIISDVLKALKVLHQRYRIIHRDIKAANILLTSTGGIKVGDFGVSRRFDSGSSETMTIVGTPYWMAPEVINGIHYSFPADIWSIGITALELAEGSPPYTEYQPTKAMIEIAIRGFPGFRYPGLHSDDFIDFVNRCVKFDPAERPSIDELLEHPFIALSQTAPRMVLLENIIATGPTTRSNASQNTDRGASSESRSKEQTGQTDSIFESGVEGSELATGDFADLRTARPMEDTVRNRQSTRLRTTFVNTGHFSGMKTTVPFSPFVIATNPEVPVETRYSKVFSRSQMEELINKEPLSQLKPVIDENGVINFKSALYDKRTPYVLAGLITFVSLMIFGRKGLFVLVLIALIARMWITFNDEKQQPK